MLHLTDLCLVVYSCIHFFASANELHKEKYIYIYIHICTCYMFHITWFSRKENSMKAFIYIYNISFVTDSRLLVPIHSKKKVRHERLKLKLNCTTTNNKEHPEFHFLTFLVFLFFNTETRKNSLKHFSKSKEN